VPALAAGIHERAMGMTTEFPWLNIPSMVLFFTLWTGMPM
jgi:hypothetical protein